METFKDVYVTQRLINSLSKETIPSILSTSLRQNREELKEKRDKFEEMVAELRNLTLNDQVLFTVPRFRLFLFRSLLVLFSLF